ncbi:hypothetical protein M3O96_00705 [Aquiflexum sp. TKW24L]|uniref:hypothetical protein n=1 Tax=Aquiflexum sp. TKW24L TaxID=2942212 RepID=UPI0020BFEE73|nr:hypothetical protein [Aquiflexum sp. TKW24L]MCL6257588.1 hypothetical protein [Aquiflexum sp. TKW24L]
MPSKKPLKNIQKGHILILPGGFSNKNVRRRPKNEIISTKFLRKSGYLNWLKLLKFHALTDFEITLSVCIISVQVLAF